MSHFNPAQFLEMQIEGANATEFVNVPEGDYTGVIESAEILEWQKKDDPSQAGLKLRVTYVLEVPPEIAAEIGRENPKIRQEIFLDLNDSDGLDMGKGKNVGLGRLREAVGLNTGVFSFPMLPGRMVLCMVKHRAGQVEGQVYAEVRQVAKLG